jgi:S-DNA-T family DNA segregation ATPase FtsK/SpoIIIE
MRRWRWPATPKGSPAQVTHDELPVAADLAAAVFAKRSSEEWRRALVYNYPEPVERDLAWLGRHTVHEGEHNLFDVDRLLSQRLRHP